jgi:hypothetical protein
MKKLVSGILGSQEMFEIDGRLSVSREYSEEQAIEMGIHRSKRVGELALTEATRGFKRNVSGLWVPHSGTENSAVTKFPEAFVRQSALFIKEKVFEKYLGGESEYDISEARVAVWAQFAADSQRRTIANQFDAWRIDGRNKALAMNAGITFDGYVDRYHIESNPKAMGAIAAYMADLKSYIGHPDMKNGVKRVWMQDRHRKKQEAHLTWTQQFLENQIDWEFDRWFAEAYYNHRSRAKFWHDVTHKSFQMRDDIIVQQRINSWKKDMKDRGYDV